MTWMSGNLPKQTMKAFTPRECLGRRHESDASRTEGRKQLEGNQRQSRLAARLIRSAHWGCREAQGKSAGTGVRTRAPLKHLAEPAWRKEHQGRSLSTSLLTVRTRFGSCCGSVRLLREHRACSEVLMAWNLKIRSQQSEGPATGCMMDKSHPDDSHCALEHQDAPGEPRSRCEKQEAGHRGEVHERWPWSCLRQVTLAWN